MDPVIALSTIRNDDHNITDRLDAAHALDWWIKGGGSVPADMSPHQVIKLSEMFVSINSYLGLI